MINKGQAAWFGLAWLPVACEKRIYCFLHKRILPNSLAIPKFEELFSFPILKNNHKNFREFNNSKRVYHLSTKSKNSGWKFKWFPKKMEILRRIPLFPFQPKCLGKCCTIYKLPLDPVHFGLFSRLSMLQMQLPF